MSTRCNIIIHKNGATANTDAPIYIYRHHDGYPECTGKHLASIVQECQSSAPYIDSCEFATRLIKGFLTEDEAVNDLNGDYELTSSIHGDVEYIYDIYLDEKSVICHSARRGEKCRKVDIPDFYFKDPTVV